MPICPKCGKDFFDIVDRDGVYSEDCWRCGYHLEVVKWKARRDFKCKNCGSGVKLMIDTDDRLAFKCIDCDVEETVLQKKELGVAESLFRELERKGKPFYTEEETKRLLQPSKVPEEPTYQREPSQVRCPRCNSKQISTGQRGYSIIWKWIGSNRTMNRCAKCGHKWEPRK